MEWIDDELKNRMKKYDLRKLEELKLCFDYQYPTKNIKKYFHQFMFSLYLLPSIF